MTNPILVKLGLESSTVATATPQATLPAADPLPSETIATTPSSTLGVAVPSDVEPEVTFVEANTTISTDPIPTATPVASVESETELPAGELAAPDGLGTPVTPEATIVPEIPAGELPADVVPPVVVDTIAADVPAVAVDTDIEYSEVASDVENASNGVDTLISAAVALEEIAGLKPELINQDSDKKLVYLAIASATAPLQDTEFSESISIENINDKIRQIWEAIKAAIKKLFAKIVSFFKYSESNVGRIKEQVAEATSDLKKAKESDFTVQIKEGPVHRVSREGSVITVESSNGLETLSHTSVKYVGDTIHDMNVRYSSGFTHLLSVLSKVESHIKHYTKDLDATSLIKELSTEFKENAILKHAGGIEHIKVSSETMSESQLLSVFSILNINVVNSEKLLTLIGKQVSAIRTVVDRITAAGSKLHEQSPELDSWVRNVVLREANRAIVSTSADYRVINKALNVHTSTSTAIVRHLGQIAATK